MTKSKAVLQVLVIGTMLGTSGCRKQWLDPNTIVKRISLDGVVRDVSCMKVQATYECDFNLSKAPVQLQNGWKVVELPSAPLEGEPIHWIIFQTAASQQFDSGSWIFQSQN